MMRSALLGFGLALSTATQLRFGGLPIGPGELVIVLWIVLCVFDLLLGRTSSDFSALYRLATFWIVFALALSIGTFFGFAAQYGPALHMVLHDAFAYLLMAVLGCLAVSIVDAPAQFRRTAWWLMLFGNIGIAIQIAVGWDLISLPPVSPWFWDRFRGWTENPNQLALTSFVMLMLAVYLATTSKGLVSFVGWLAVIGPFAAGRLSKSDTFISVTFFSVAILVVLRLRAWATAAASSLDLRHAFVVLAMILALPAAVSVLPYAKTGASDAEAFALSMAKDKGGEASEHTLDLRLFLWQEALEKGLSHGSFGLGPGPHLDPPPELLRDIDDPHELFEAHNTPLDVFLQAGILGVAALVVLLATTALQLYRRRADALFTFVVALAVFSNAHFLLRHPIIWFGISLSVSAGCTLPKIGLSGAALSPVPNARG